MDKLYADMKNKGLIEEGKYSKEAVEEFLILRESTTGLGLVHLEETDTYHYVDFEAGEMPKNIIDKLIERRN